MLRVHFLRALAGQILMTHCRSHYLQRRVRATAGTTAPAVAVAVCAVAAAADEQNPKMKKNRMKRITAWPHCRSPCFLLRVVGTAGVCGDGGGGLARVAAR